jgi:hypothetical protein
MEGRAGLGEFRRVTYTYQKATCDECIDVP